MRDALVRAMSPSCQSVSVLLVEDNPSEAFLFLRTMEHALDADWVIAADAEDALARLDDGLEPAFAIVDLTLPGISGLELIATLRESARWSELPIFVLTGSQNPDDERRARAIGIDGYVSKPGGFDDLNDALDVLNGSDSLRAILRQHTA